DVCSSDLLRHALHLSLGGVHGLNSANNTVDLVFVVLTRHTDQMVAQLAYWHLVFAVTDVDLIDRHATGELIDAALKLRHHRLEAVLIAFCNKDHARVADNAVNDVLLAGHRNALLDLPCHTNGVFELVIQCPAGHTRLVFHALVHIAFQAAGENDHGYEETNAQPQNEHEPLAVKEQANEEK